MRCPNCYNDLPEDVTCCPSCTFLLPAHFQRTEANVLTDLAAVTGSRPAVAVPAGPVGAGPAAERRTEEGAEEGAEQAAGAEVAEPEVAGAGGPAAQPKQKNAWGLERTGPLRPESANGKPGTQARPSREYERSLKRRDASRKGKGKGKESDSPSRSAAIARIVVGVVILSGVGVYLFLFTDLFHGKISYEKASFALKSFRQLPSNTKGMTVDEVASGALAESRKTGQLKAYTGWITKPIMGDRSKVIVIFSFQEKDNTERKAEWQVDVAANQVEARTDLAKAIYSGTSLHN